MFRDAKHNFLIFSVDFGVKYDIFDWFMGLM